MSALGGKFAYLFHIFRAVIQFLPDIGDHIRTFLGMEFLVHSSKGYADDVAMMQLAAEILAQFKPEIVNQIHIFRPEPGRMRPQIHEYRWSVRGNNFE